MNDNLNRSGHYTNYNYYNTMSYKNDVKYLKSTLKFKYNIKINCFEWQLNFLA